MAYLYFNSSYAPCGFLIVRTDGDPYNDKDTVLIQSDWDFPGVAQSCGWSLRNVQAEYPPAEQEALLCDHDGTDGTVKCPECGLTAGDFIGAAYDWLREHDGEEFEGLEEYLAANV